MGCVHELIKYHFGIAVNTVLVYLIDMAKNDDTEEFMSEEAYLLMRAKWIDYANSTSMLSHVQSRVAVFIALRAGPDKRHSYWSVDAMAKELGCSTKSVTETTLRLEKPLKMLHIVRSKRGGNKYFLRWPFGIIT